MENEPLKTVLIVDDEKHLREILRFDLRKFRYRILEAADGQQALQIAGQESIDLVISDVRMPLMTGDQLLQNLRNRNAAHPPFVFMTAFADISSEEALAQGAEAFLRKPLGKQEIVDVVKKALIPKETRWAQTDITGESARKIDFSTEPAIWEFEAKSSSGEIGQGGMFLPMIDDFPSSFELLHFKIDLNEIGTLKGVGQVRWVRQEEYDGLQTGIGMEFLQLEEQSRGALLKYLRANSPKAYIPLGKKASHRINDE